MEDKKDSEIYEELERGEEIESNRKKGKKNLKKYVITSILSIIGIALFTLYCFSTYSFSLKYADAHSTPLKCTGGSCSKKSSKELIEERIKYIKDTYNIDCPKPTPYIPEKRSVASMIDHTLLNQDATPDQVKKICNEALKYEFAAVCVNENYVALAHSVLKDSKIKIASVVNFPLGNADTETKVFESLQAIKNGASEIDMVINCGWVKAGMYKEVFDDIHQMSKAIHDKKALLKVIIESTCLEKDELIVDSCLLSSAADADFVKTSTGFHKNGGAKVEHVKLMRETVGGKLGVKASGGIRSAEAALAMIEAGATRLGASAGVQIVESLKK